MDVARWGKKGHCASNIQQSSLLVTGNTWTSRPNVGNKEHSIKSSMIFGFMLGRWVRNKYIHAFVSGPQAETCNSIRESIAVRIWHEEAVFTAKEGRANHSPYMRLRCPSMHEGLEPQAPTDPTHTAQVKGARDRHFYKDHTKQPMEFSCFSIFFCVDWVILLENSNNKQTKDLHLGWFSLVVRDHSG